MDVIEVDYQYDTRVSDSISSVARSVAGRRETGADEPDWPLPLHNLAGENGQPGRPGIDRLSGASASFVMSRTSVGVRGR